MFQVNTVSCILIIVLIAVGLWLLGSGRCQMMCGPSAKGGLSGGSTESYHKHHNPKTYYEHGGWNDHPPQVPNHRHLTSGPVGVYPSTDEPPPMDIPEPGDLCQQCIGHCQLKIWAGVMEVPKGQNNRQHCTKECKLECTVFD